MNSNDHEKFGKLIAGVFGVYGRECSDEVIEVYYRCLEDYSIDDLSRCFSAHIKNPDNGVFIPKPADIIRMMKGNSKSKSIIAWDKAFNAINSSYDVVFDDPIIHAVIRDMGGWVKFCSSVTDFNKDKIETAFRERYKNYIEYGLSDFPKILKGNGNFYRPEPPRFIGNHDKALQIMNEEVSFLEYQIN